MYVSYKLTNEIKSALNTHGQNKIIPLYEHHNRFISRGFHVICIWYIHTWKTSMEIMGRNIVLQQFEKSPEKRSTAILIKTHVNIGNSEKSL